MVKFVNQFIRKASKIRPEARVGVIHPCSDYALLGAIEVIKYKIGKPVLIGPLAKIKVLAVKLNLSLSGIECIDVPHSHAAAETAVALVKNGKLDILMKGSLHTDELMHAVLDSKTGIRTDRRVTHCCVMDIPKYNSPLLVADIAINVSPDLDTKKHITQNAIDLAKAIGIKNVKVAVLSADEQVRSQIPSTIDAAALSKMGERNQITSALIDGPLAFDVAISAIATKIKHIDSDVAGHANILIVPTIEAGNILVKQLKYFANALMPGVVIGAAVPIVLTSRADDGLTRAASCALAILYAKWYRNFIGGKYEHFDN